jgi:CBS domain-containing protein
MTTDVVWVSPDKTVHEIAQVLSEKGISAMPVINDQRIVGIVSEGDLLQREELGTDQEASTDADYNKSHGTYARDVMTRTVVTVSEDALLAEIVERIQTKHIKRVLVTRGAKLVGVVSRSNIVKTLAARPEGAGEPNDSDDDIIRFKVIETLIDMPGTHPCLTTVDISNGVVELNGSVEDEMALDASYVAVEHIAHIVELKDHRSVLQPYWG